MRPAARRMSGPARNTIMFAERCQYTCCGGVTQITVLHSLALCAPLTTLLVGASAGWARKAGSPIVAADHLHANGHSVVTHQARAVRRLHAEFPARRMSRMRRFL
jgi:hypothetical protein